MKKPLRSRAAVERVDSNKFHAHLVETVKASLESLTFREREIIKLRLGIGDGYDYTEEEVAHIFKLKPQDVSRITAIVQPLFCKSGHG